MTHLQTFLVIEDTQITQITPIVVALLITIPGICSGYHKAASFSCSKKCFMTVLLRIDINQIIQKLEKSFTSKQTANDEREIIAESSNQKENTMLVSKPALISLSQITGYYQFTLLQ